MIVFFLTAIFFSMDSTMATAPIIFGEDDRLDSFEVQNSLHKEIAKSTAAQIPNERIIPSAHGFLLQGKSLSEYMNICPDERFASEPSVANCSGFLVAPDIMATAGHCYERKGMCENYSWVFNYQKNSKDQNEFEVSSEDVYRCKEVLEYGFDVFKFDYALIRLDRPVKSRSPLKLQAEPKIGEALVLIGHPSGLPQKTAAGAQTKSISETEFTANVDAFGVNSGSAVFNAKTGEVVGILVKGYADYLRDPVRSCSIANRVSDEHIGNIMSKNSQFQGLLEKYLP